MSIKIVGGEFKGREIKTPKTYTSNLRPTASRVRESLFNILFQEIPGKKVLDLFAGIGSLGFEAVSRGASFVTFIEKDPKHLAFIRKNAETLRIEDKVSILRGNLPEILGALKSVFDVVFIDPPYERFFEHGVLGHPQFLKLLHPGSLIIVEQSKHSDMVSIEPFKMVRIHRVGDTCLCFFKLG